MIIDDTTSNDLLYVGPCGTVERDYSVQPIEMLSAPDTIKLIPKSEWDARFEEQEATESSVEHEILRSNFQHLDQGQSNYCWAHSTVHAMMLRKLMDHEPVPQLSAFAIAATIMDGANRGGWSGLSAQFARERGVPTQDKWPQGQFRGSLEGSEQNRVLEDVVDLARPVHSQNLSEELIATLLFHNIPVQLDFAWWGHAVCGIRWHRFERGSWGPKFLNSWRGWGNSGIGGVHGQRRIPMGAVATRVVGAGLLV